MFEWRGACRTNIRMLKFWDSRSNGGRGLIRRSCLECAMLEQKQTSKLHVKSNLNVTSPYHMHRSTSLLLTNRSTIPALGSRIAVNVYL